MANNQHVQQVLHDQDGAANKIELECMKTYGPKLQSNEPFYNETAKTYMCPPFFDSLYCWPPQLPNTTASVPCPSYVIGFLQDKNATRRCTENAQWFMKDEGSTYTNYSACSTGKLATVYTYNVSQPNDPNDNISVEIVKLIKILCEAGYALSLISLIIAFTIMFKIKRLHCARNILHMNLFASFILRSFMHILKDTLFEDGLGLKKDMLYKNGSWFFHIVATENNFECKLIVSLVQYFTTANYSWILMEGLYLNNLILRALFTDSSKSLVYYITFGWGLPLMVVIPWIIARIFVEDTLCWTMNENFQVLLIIEIPVFTSLLINLVLFVIISVVLYKKLKSSINEEARRYLKWAKSTMVLVPLFGVNYVVLAVFYFLNEKTIWILTNRLSGSFQGFFVAILYCFLNGEVKSELKPHIKSILIFLATNNVTKFCFPRRKEYIRSAAGRTSVCTTMSCSSLYNNSVSNRNTKTKFDQLSKVKLTNLHAEQQKETFNSNGLRHSIPKTGYNGHYAPNLTFIQGRYPMNMTTNLDTALANEIKPHHYPQNLPTCQEEVSMLGEDAVKNNLELD